MVKEKPSRVAPAFRFSLRDLSDLGVPLVELNVVKIISGTGTVSVKNADNSGDGKSTATAALFGYSNQLGSDQVFPSEASGIRTLQFNDSASEMFSFYVNVTAFTAGSGGGGGAPAAPAGGGVGSGSQGSGNSLLPLTKVMRITVNPLTKVVSAKLL